MEKLTSYMNTDFQGEFLSGLEEYSGNPHIEYLKNELNSSTLELYALLDYGFKNLPEEDERPNETLSFYFLAISELKDLSPELRDLTLDASIYCKNDSDFPVPRSRKELLEEFKKLSE